VQPNFAHHRKCHQQGGCQFFVKKLTGGCANARVPLSSFVRKGGGKIFDFDGGFDKSNKFFLPYFKKILPVN